MGTPIWKKVQFLLLFYCGAFIKIYINFHKNLIIEEDFLNFGERGRTEVPNCKKYQFFLVL